MYDFHNQVSVSDRVNSLAVPLAVLHPVRIAPHLCVSVHPPPIHFCYIPPHSSPVWACVYEARPLLPRYSSSQTLRSGTQHKSARRLWETAL